MNKVTNIIIYLILLGFQHGCGSANFFAESTASMDSSPLSGNSENQTEHAEKEQSTSPSELESSDEPEWINGVFLVCHRVSREASLLEIGCGVVDALTGLRVRSFPEGFSAEVHITNRDGSITPTTFDSNSGLFSGHIEFSQIELAVAILTITIIGSPEKVVHTDLLSDTLKRSTEEGIEPVSFSLIAPGNFRYDTTRTSSLTSSPLLSWNPILLTQLSHYEVSIGTTSGAQDILNWRSVGTNTSIRFNDLKLQDAKNYFVSIRAVDKNGASSEVVTGDAWQNLICPDGYIKVQGNETPGLGGEHYVKGTKTRFADRQEREVSDFCVMKFEAKMFDGITPEFSGNDLNTIDIADPVVAANLNAVSVPTNRPWVNIPHSDPTKPIDAVRACEKTGPGYSLVNNAQWQAIAREIEVNSRNWSERTPFGSSENLLNRGHSDFTTLITTGGRSYRTNPAHGIDFDGCYHTMTNSFDGSLVPPDCGGQWHPNKRTHTLSSGAIIWDISGNVREWALDLTANSDLTSLIDFVSSGPFGVNKEANQLKWGPSLDHSSKTATYFGGLGQFYGGLTQGSAVIRGGQSSYFNQVGIFSAYLNHAPNEILNGVGFRCAYAP